MNLISLSSHIEQDKPAARELLAAVGFVDSEVLKLIHEGIGLHIQTLREAGEPIRPPTSRSQTVKVRAA